MVEQDPCPLRALLAAGKNGVSRDGLIANARIHEALHHQRLDALADRAVSELVRQLREGSKKARARRGQMRRR